MTAARLSLIIGIINSFILVFVILSLGAEENDEKATKVDNVAFQHINDVEDEGYLTERIKGEIRSSLSEFDEIEIVGTQNKVGKGQTVNLMIKAKDKGSLLKREKNFSREVMVNGVAK